MILLQNKSDFIEVILPIIGVLLSILGALIAIGAVYSIVNNNRLKNEFKDKINESKTLSSMLKEYNVLLSVQSQLLSGINYADELFIEFIGGDQNLILGELGKNEKYRIERSVELEKLIDNLKVRRSLFTLFVKYDDEDLERESKYKALYLIYAKGNSDNDAEFLDRYINMEKDQSLKKLAKSARKRVLARSVN